MIADTNIGEFPEQAEIAAISSSPLASQALNATMWTVIDYASSTALRVVNSIVLTRLLLPESFGLMTIVTTLVVGLNLLSDLGLGPSVIQSARGDDPVFLNTAWTIQTLRGMAIFLLSFALAWPMARVYHEPRLLLLLPVLGFNAVISALYSTNLLTMSRHLNVRRLFFVDITTQVVTLLVSVGLALWHPSVWALIIGTLVGSAYRLALSHTPHFVPGHANRFHWDKQSRHELLHFGKWILLATACYFFASQADRLILGRLVSLSMLGIYGIAYSISDIPRAIINAFAQRVGYPFLAKFGTLPPAEFRATFLKYRLRALLAGAIMLCLMVNVGGLFVSVVYDRRYAAASWMIPILALGLWHTLLYATTMPALFCLGNSRYAALGNGAYCVSALIAIPLGFHLYGMPGAVVAVAVGDLPLYLVTVMGASREGVSTWVQDLQATACFVTLVLMGFALRTHL